MYHFNVQKCKNLFSQARYIYIYNVKVRVTFKFIMINNLIKDRNFEIVNLLSTEQKRAVPSELYINSVISFC